MDLITYEQYQFLLSGVFDDFLKEQGYKLTGNFHNPKEGVFVTYSGKFYKNKDQQVDIVLLYSGNKNRFMVIFSKRKPIMLFLFYLVKIVFSIILGFYLSLLHFSVRKWVGAYHKKYVEGKGRDRWSLKNISKAIEGHTIGEETESLEKVMLEYKKFMIRNLIPVLQGTKTMQQFLGEVTLKHYNMPGN